MKDIRNSIANADQSMAHRSWFARSDSWALFALMVGGTLEYVLPTTMWVESIYRHLAGSAFLLGGWFLLVIAKLEFRKYLQPSAPGVSTNVLVTTGIFARYRNPMYVGVVVVVFALGFLFNSWWITLGSSLLTALLLHYRMILPEERYLYRRFGKEFAIYVKRSKRWI